MKQLTSIHPWPFVLSVFFLAFTVCAGDLFAQSARPTETFYVRPLVGFTSYVGDNDRSFFPNGQTFPYSLGFELGYQFNVPLSLGVAYNLGQYAWINRTIVPTDEEDDGLRHSIDLIARYTFGGSTGMAPYLQAGAHTTFGEVIPYGTTTTEQRTAFGPLVGVGVDIPLSNRISLFFEGTSRASFPDDAVDGREGDGAGSYDLLSTIGTGLKINFKSATRAPQVFSIDGPSRLQTGEPGTFEASVSGGTNQAAEYRWEWGDGTSSTGLNATHVFRVPGSYTIQFTASNRAGSDSENLMVTVVQPVQEPQITSITADPSSPNTETQVRFRANVRGDAPLTYRWDFGDGNTTSGPTPTHQYENGGTYTVSLTVTNEAGSASRSLSLQVDETAPAFCTEITDLNSVYFGRNSSVLSPEARRSLDENAQILVACSDLVARITGWAAPGERNPQDLSTDRARAVEQFYISRGILRNRLDATGMGRSSGLTSKKDGANLYQRVDTVPIR